MPEFGSPKTTFHGNSEGTREKDKKEELKRKFLESLKEYIPNFNLNNEEDVRRLGGFMILSMNELFKERYSVSVPEENLPVCLIKEGIIPSYNQYYLEAEDGSKRAKINTIELSGVGDVFNGNYIAEEIAHFYRVYFGPDQSEEKITDEFFGFLGQRLWNKVVPKLDDNDYYKILAGNEENAVSKKEALRISGIIKKAVQFSKELKHEDDPDIETLEEKRRIVLIHQRGYEYASKIDIEKIHDWKNFFSLPNDEVRRRFFTSNPDYTGL